MRVYAQLLVCIVTVLSITNMHAMVFDNRFFPLYPRIFTRTLQKPSAASADLFYMFAGHGTIDGDSVGIPEILGTYDLQKLIRAATILGFANPFIGTGFDMHVMDSEIPYAMRSKIETQGLAFFWGPAAFNEYISFGVSCFFMHAFSRIHFLLNKGLNLTPVQEIMLDKIRSSVQDELGLQAPVWSTVGFSDIDAYIRAGKVWEYWYKMRRIDAGVRVGLLVPSGVTRNINNPASLPFGGNGYWGIYGALDAELELKEDWNIGIWVRMSKRFSRTVKERIPIAGEQQLFGALVGDLSVNPGLTGVFMPYFCMDDIRDGLGMQGKYTIVIHGEDVVSDARNTNRVPELYVKTLNDTSGWVAEYLTFNLFYDFAKVKMKNWYAPIVSLTWDMPVNFLLADRVSKTNRVSLGVLVSF